MKMNEVYGSARTSLVDVEVEFISKREDQAYRALDGITIDVKPGELLVLVGRSGCGKTTVLNVIAGLVQASRGKVTVLGTDCVRARPRIGYMFARDALLPWRTAVRNVEYGLELRQPKLTRQNRRERALKLLSNLGVDGNAAKRHPWQLSQGMRQRVALARTWALEPELLLMDEPFAALDAQTRADAQEQFLDIWAQSSKTVIFVTHDLSEAILLGDRVIAMDQGRLVAEVAVDIPRPRNPMTIVEDPKFQEAHHLLITTVMRNTGKTPEFQPQSSL
jgi:NitT/TauT family transport system ATP-binding protein